MAARSWQEALAQQAEEVSARVREALSVGLGLLRTELGLELGFEPQGLPSWLVLLATAALGLLLLLGLLWVVTCATGSRRKQPRSLPGREEDDEAVALGLTGGSGVPNKAAPAAPLLLKAEEQKKRNKKRLAEKGAARPNGRPVLEVSEDEIIQTVQRENPKQPLDADKKNEKVLKSAGEAAVRKMLFSLSTVSCFDTSVAPFWLNTQLLLCYITPVPPSSHLPGKHKT
uniref:Metadherin n=1 Tax=Chelonoidis abingdonii TaxID=106734 RepID=A0A8C0GHH5_CHEAB